jgi:ketosteroid isomerase-like protein
MSAQQNKQAAQDAYAAFGNGDAEGTVRDLDDSIAWTEGRRRQRADRDPQRQAGRRGAVGKLMSEGFRTTPHDFVAEGDKVVVLTPASSGARRPRAPTC